MLFKVLKIAGNWLQSIKWMNEIPGREILRDQDNTLKHIVVKWPKQMETFRFANRISHTAFVHWFGLSNVVEWFQNHNRNSVTTTKTLIFSCTTISKLENEIPTVYNWTQNSYDVRITKPCYFIPNSLRTNLWRNEAKENTCWRSFHLEFQFLLQSSQFSIKCVRNVFVCELRRLFWHLH